MLYNIIHCGLFVVSLSLNSDLRAVEFFIRDKYEKKKYYSKNVTNGSSVCNDRNVTFLLWSRFDCHSCLELALFFILSFFASFQPKDIKKDREPERGSKVSSYTKVSHTRALLWI